MLFDESDPSADPSSLFNGPSQTPLTAAPNAMAMPAPRPTTRQALQGFTSNLMYTLSHALSAAASEPGQRGTVKGLAAALAGPGQYQTLVAQQAEEKRQKDFEAQQKEEKHRSDMEKANAEVAKLRQETFSLRNPKTEFVTVTHPDGSQTREPARSGMQTNPPKKPELIEAIDEDTLPDGTKYPVYRLLPKKEGLITKPVNEKERNIDPLSDEGIARRLKFEKEKIRLQPPSDGTLTPKQVTESIQMANSYKSHPAYTDMLDVSNGMQGVATGLSQKNGLGDIAAINSFQKMVDPGATVREGDVTLIQGASGFISKVLSDFPIEKLKSGSKLPESTRDAMMKAAKELYGRRGKNFNASVGDQYKKLAKAAGIPFEYIGMDFPPLDKPASAAGPKTGTVEDGYIFQGGDPADPKSWKKQ